MDDNNKGKFVLLVDQSRLELEIFNQALEAHRKLNHNWRLTPEAVIERGGYTPIELDLFLPLVNWRTHTISSSHYGTIQNCWQVRQRYIYDALRSGVSHEKIIIRWELQNYKKFWRPVTEMPIDSMVNLVEVEFSAEWRYAGTRRRIYGRIDDGPPVLVYRD